MLLSRFKLSLRQSGRLIFVILRLVGIQFSSVITLSLTDHRHLAGTQPSLTASPRSCPAGQFSCPPPGGCIEAVKRCDGIPHCRKGEDEHGCYPYDNSTETQSDRYSLMLFVRIKTQFYLF